VEKKSNTPMLVGLVVVIVVAVVVAFVRMQGNKPVEGGGPGAGGATTSGEKMNAPPTAGGAPTEMRGGTFTPAPK
jgi:hypothetical protein